MKAIILNLGILITIVGCQNSQPVILIPASHENDCDSCLLDNFIVAQNLTDTTSIDTINETVAIEFFNLLETIHKYDPEFPDSLPEKCQNDDRQTIYKAHDLQGMYYAFVRPILDSLEVKIIDPSKTLKKMSFLVDGKLYNIDLNYFVENDGIIFFTPGKLPVLWNLESGTKYCSDGQFTRCYYE